MTDQSDGQPDRGRYGMPQHPDFAAPGAPVTGRDPYPRQLAQQPPPVPGPSSGGRFDAPGDYSAPRPMPGAGYGAPSTAPAGQPAQQRPAMITLSLVLIVTGSLCWMALLGFVWIFVYVARDSFGYSGVEGAFYHMLERFHLRMLQGLAVVLFGAPGLAVVLSFFLLRRAQWPRIALSALAVLSIVACGVLLAGDLNWMIPGVVYIAFACLILWTPAVTRWCAEEQPSVDQPSNGPVHLTQR